VPDRFGDKEAGEFRAVRGRQGESGPEGRDCHVADEGEVVGQEKSHEAQVERPPCSRVCPGSFAKRGCWQ